MRLHQRVGRLNRYGRPSQFGSTASNPDTVESMIWGKLESKLNSIHAEYPGSAMDEPRTTRMQLVLGNERPRICLTGLFSGAVGAGRNDWVNGLTSTVACWRRVRKSKLIRTSRRQSFDLSDLKEVPPLDSPICSRSSITCVQSAAAEGSTAGLSFKTPERWLTTHAIKKS